MLLEELRVEMKKSISFLLILLAWQPVAGEVKDSAANGFTTVNEVVVNANRADAWKMALEIGSWWSPDHTISGDAGRLSIDAVLQGCFCESLGSEAGVVHLVVTTVMPETSLRMTGGLGPIGLMGADGNMTWDFEDTDDGTRVRMTYAVGGYMAGGMDQIAPAVDAVLDEALARLQAYIETGSPEPSNIE
jgi:hypothetical protein